MELHSQSPVAPKAYSGSLAPWLQQQSAPSAEADPSSKSYGELSIFSAFSYCTEDLCEGGLKPVCNIIAFFRP